MQSLHVKKPASLGSAACADKLRSDATPGSGRRILISIPNGFQLRQFVHSGVLARLLELGFQALILSPNREHEGFAAELPTENVQVRALEPRFGPLLRRYMEIRKHLLYIGPVTETLRRTVKNTRRNHPWTVLTAQAGNRLLRFSPALHRAFLKREHIILRDKAIHKLLADEPIDLMLLTTPGYSTWDTFLFHAAAQHGIPVLSAVLSWDNISTKCLVNPQPDKLLVWSDHMRDEVIELQGIPAERIVVTGPPHYDVFANATRFGSRSENLRPLGLDPNRRLLFYGTNHAGFFPDEIEVVKLVAQWVEDDALGTPCQLLVRLHPQAVTGPYKLLTGQYLSLASERVKVELPPVRDSKLLWDLPESDLEHLVRVLRDADVVINTASTISIDAAIFDRPVVAVAYDPAGDIPYERSVRRYYDYTHMSPVVRAGAVRLARSPDELRQKIVDYLRQPDLDREARRHIVEQQFGRVDGNSAARVVDEVIRVAAVSKGNGHELR